MNPIDKHTGRPVGDHGTAMELIAFVIDNARCSSEYYEILTAWRDGRMSDEWPEFYETLAPPVVTTRVTLTVWQRHSRSSASHRSQRKS